MIWKSLAIALATMTMSACGEISFGNINLGGGTNNEDNTEQEGGNTESGGDQNPDEGGNNEGGNNEGGNDEGGNNEGGTTNPDTPVGNYPSQEGSGEKDGYTLVWEDLFDGEALNTDIWDVEVRNDGCGNAELEYYRKENVAITTDEASGRRCLTITARREDYGGRYFTSGRLTTRGKKAFQYGKIEAYVKLPKTANGLWPAFWMMGNNYDEVGWPRCGEIDILEMGNAQGIKSGTQETFMNGACHWGYYKGSAYPNYGKHSNAPYSVQDGEYHLFTIIWDEQMINMYLDLDKYPNVEPYYAIGITEKGDDWGTGYYFHHDFFILFNLAVGGHFTGIYNTAQVTALPNVGDEAKMYVDYVKVFQK